MHSTSTLFIANISFEEELTHHAPPSYSLPDALSTHPVYQQLQFLPLLWASPTDTLLLTALPSSSYLAQFPTLPTLLTFDALPNHLSTTSNTTLQSWGASAWLASLAERLRLPYAAPSLAAARMANDKGWLVEQRPSLPLSTSLTSLAEVDAYLQRARTARRTILLKQRFGLAGRAFLIVDPHTPPSDAKLHHFCAQGLTLAPSLIGEAWVKRTADFSTHWTLDRSGSYQRDGVVTMRNSVTGQFEMAVAHPEGTIPPSLRSFFEEHVTQCELLLKRLHAGAFFGPVGFDAFLYRDGEGAVRHHLSEINGRWSIGRVALTLQRQGKRGSPSTPLGLEYAAVKRPTPGLLPHELIGANGEPFSFKRQLLLHKEVL